MTDAFNDHEERNVLAGELALRLLSPEDEIRARALQNTDPDFAAQVEGWNTQLAAFADGIAPVEPSAGLWPRIDAATAPVANDNGRVAAFWRTWAIGATGLLAASVGAVALLVTQAEPVVPPAPPSVVQTGVTRVATLALEDGAPILTIAYDTATGNLFLAGQAGGRRSAGGCDRARRLDTSRPDEHPVRCRWGSHGCCDLDRAARYHPGPGYTWRARRGVWRNTAALIRIRRDLRVV
jgi:anti-sigma-K factor RskA